MSRQISCDDSESSGIEFLEKHNETSGSSNSSGMSGDRSGYSKNSTGSADSINGNKVSGESGAKDLPPTDAPAEDNSTMTTYSK